MGINYFIVVIVIIHTILQHLLNNAWRKAYKTKGIADDSMIIAAFVLEGTVVIGIILTLL